MKIPSTMTEEEVLEKIKIVIDRISRKYIFPGNELEDIKQQSYVICIEALDRYDEDRPLENFLSHNLSNRLKNFVRDNYYTKKDSEKKKKLMKPVELTSENPEYVYTNNEENIDFSLLAKIVDIELPAKYRINYIKLVNGVHIPKIEREELISAIREISNKHGYTEEDLL
jgi:DNA-directed RNA polymerase specialized sigma24 family protein